MWGRGSRGRPRRHPDTVSYGWDDTLQVSSVTDAAGDQGNDLRVTAGDTHLVQSRPGITARTTDTTGTGAPTGADALTTFYTRMPDGRLLSSRGQAGTFYYVTDHNKSVLNLIGADGQRAGTYQYSPHAALKGAVCRMHPRAPAPTRPEPTQPSSPVRV